MNSSSRAMQLFRRILRSVGYLALAFFVLVIFIAGFTQSKFFKHRLRTIIVSTLSEQLNGSLSIGTIRGNFLTGVSIDSVIVTYGTEDVLTIDRISIAYRPLPLFERTLDVETVLIDNPSIHFRRLPSGDWNIFRLFKTPTTGSSGGFDWSITVADLHIRRGTIHLVDQTDFARRQPATTPTDSFFDYNNFTLVDIDLQLKGRSVKNSFEVQIVHAGMVCKNPDLQLSHMRGEFVYGQSGVEINNLLLNTPRSSLELSAKLRTSNLLDGVKLSRLQRDSVSLHIKSDRIDFRDVKALLPQIQFLEGTAAIQLDAEGEFGHLTIDRLHVRTLESEVTVAGNVDNLHEPDSLFLDLRTENSTLTPADAARLMPTFGLPFFTRFGSMRFTSSYVGSPLRFNTTTRLKSPSGEVHFDGAMDLRGSLPVYDLAFSTRKLSLERLTGNDRITASISSRGTLKGTGFSLDSMNAALVLRLDSSRIQDLLVTSGELRAEGSPHLLTIESDLSAGIMQANVNGRADLTDSSRPSFDGEIDLTSFDLSKILLDTSYRSDLSLHARGSARGGSLDDMSGSIRLALSPSTYRGRPLGSEEIELAFDQQHPLEKQIKLRSSFADIDVEGRFSLDLATAALTAHTTALIDAIEAHAAPPEKRLRGGRRASSPERLQASGVDRLDFSFDLNVKNIDPIAALAGGVPFNARGHVRGNISGEEGQLNLVSDGVVDEFFIGDLDHGTYLRKSAFSIDARNLTVTHPLEDLRASINISVASGLLDGRPLQRMVTSVDYSHLKGKFSVRGVIDSTYDVVLAGLASVQANTYAFDLDTLFVRSNFGSWHNDQDVQLRLNYEGLRIMHARERQGSGALSITGALLHNGGLDLTATLENYDLAGLNFFLRNPELGTTSNRGFRGLANAMMHISGTKENPAIEFSATAESTFFRQTPIGVVKALLLYENKEASLNLIVKRSALDTMPSLSLSGTVPIDLGLAGVHDVFQDSRQRLRLVSERFDLSVLDPLLPDFDAISGSLHCDVLMEGSPKHPLYSGIIDVHDVRCVFGPNNIPYVMNGRLKPLGDRILLDTLYVRNPGSEPDRGDARFIGAVTMKDYAVDSLDITAVGTILLMTEATKKIAPTFYGTLLTESDVDGVHLTGTIGNPSLSGKLSVRRADLLFPPTTTREETGEQSLTYVLVDDTTTSEEGSDLFSARFTGSANGDGRQVTSPSHRPSFAERLRYNLSIESRGATAIKMVFTPTTNEELYAEITGGVNALNERGTPLIYGDITVAPGSYYNFFRRFEATGKLKFVGQWDNPELEIDAQYVGFRQVPQQVSDQNTNIGDQKLQEQKVIVGLTIRGTRYEPKLDLGLKVQLEAGKDPVDWASQTAGGDVQSDAISFILTGKFRDQLTAQERQGLASNFGSASVSGLTSSLLSGILTDFLRNEFPFIRSAELSYQGAGTIQESANLRLSGEAFRGYWRFGGRILNDIGNANVSYQLSLGDVFDATSIRNLFIELERKVEGSDFTEDRRLTNGARLYYRISF